MDKYNKEKVFSPYAFHSHRIDGNNIRMFATNNEQKLKQDNTGSS
jgi:hypothetical protein